MYGVIYKITNKINGKPYVGQTTRTIKERFIEHAKAKTHLGNAIRKYGRKNFTIEVIEKCETPEQLNVREIFWIACFNCKHPNGYNFTDGGEGSKGFTEESLEKMRLPKSPEAVVHMSVASKKRANTPEGKAQLDKARNSRWEKEKARPPEQRGQFNRYRKCIFPVIEGELVQRKISHALLAKILGVTAWSISRKMRGDVCFSIEEAEAIKNFLDSDMTLEELFFRNYGRDVTETFSIRRSEWSTYTVLKSELDRQKVKTAELADHLGLTRTTIARKLQGKVGITPEQKEAIKKFLNVEMSVEELFKCCE